MFPWLRWPKYSLRLFLIATTIASVIVGAVVMTWRRYETERRRAIHLAKAREYARELTIHLDEAYSFALEAHQVAHGFCELRAHWNELESPDEVTWTESQMLRRAQLAHEEWELVVEKLEHIRIVRSLKVKHQKAARDPWRPVSEDVPLPPKHIRCRFIVGPAPEILPSELVTEAE